MPNSVKQLSLISLYGEKEESLRLLINNCIQQIQQSPLSSLFHPYDVEQIHATITGMEKTTQSTKLYNQNIKETTQQYRTMRFSRFLAIIHQNFPIQCQFGGFHPSFSEFSSFGSLPYLRTFQIQWKNERVTLIGWPQRNALLNTRDNFQTQCNIAHKYKSDNDLFMVLGEIVKPKNLLPSEIHQLQQDTLRLETSIREHLYRHQVNITIDINSLHIAQYRDITFPLSSTIIHPVNERTTSSKFIKILYN